jgi:hypothetical protein
MNTRQRHTPLAEPDTIEALFTTSARPAGDRAARNGKSKHAQAYDAITDHGERAQLEIPAVQLKYLQEQAATLRMLATKLRRSSSAGKRPATQRAKKKR